MANQSIYAAFERMWHHLTNKLSNYVTQDSLSTSLNQMTKIYVQSEMPEDAPVYSLWVDTDEENVVEEFLNAEESEF